MSDKQKVTAKQWEIAIRKAKQYVANYDKARWIIADLALEVCDVTHGGRKTGGIYTLTKFAEEIEINSRTLSEWTRVKRYVYDKLTIEEQKKAHSFPYNAFTETILGIDEGTPDKVVQKKFRSILQENPIHRKFTKYAKHLGGILYNAQRPLNLMEVKQEDLENIIKKCDMISDFLRKELELREKYADPKDAAKKRLNMKTELARRLSSPEAAEA